MSTQALSPYLQYSQVILQSAEKLQSAVNETYQKEDASLAWSLIGANYNLSISSGTSTDQPAIKATYVYNSCSTFRKTSDQFQHLFFRQVIYPQVPIFAYDAKTYTALQNLESSLGSGMFLTYQYDAKAPATVNFCAVLAVPYKPVPGTNNLTAEELSVMLSNFITAGQQAKANIQKIIDSSTLSQLPIDPQGSSSMRTVLPNLSGMAFDNFDILAKIAAARIERFPAFSKSLESKEDSKFPAKSSVSVFSTSILGGVYVPYSPEFFIKGSNLDKISLVYGTNLPGPSIIQIWDQNNAQGTFDWYNTGATQLLPKDGSKHFNLCLP